MDYSDSILDVFKWSSREAYVDGGFIVEDVNKNAQTYKILDHLHMYMDFVKIDKTKDQEVVQFISKYGFLEENVFRRESHGTLAECGAYKENIDTIISEVSNFKEVIEAYYYINASDFNAKELKEKLIFLDRIPEKSGIMKELILLEIENNESDMQALKLTAMKAISIRVNHFIKNVSHKLIVTNDSMGKPVFTEQWSSDNLINAMYYMFYIELINKRVIRKCQNIGCNKFFVLESGHLNKKYCDNATCARQQTVRNWREKKKAINEKLPS